MLLPGGKMRHAGSSATETGAVETAAATFFARSGFVDHKFAAVEGFAVESRNGGARLGVIFHFNETEALGATGIAIGREADAVDFSVSGKGRIQIVFGHRIRHVSHINVHLDPFSADLLRMLFCLLGQKSIDVRDDAALCPDEHGESKCNTQRGIHIGEIRILKKIEKSFPRTNFYHAFNGSQST